MSEYKNPSRSIRIRYTTGMVITAITAIILSLLLNYIISSYNNDNKLINQAGRQRMLSQRIFLLALDMVHHKNDKAADKLLLEDTITELKNSQIELDNISNKVITRQQTDEINSYIELALRIANESKEDELIFLKFKNLRESLLLYLDNQASFFEEKANSHLSNLKAMIFLAMIFMILTLTIQLFSIFIPMEKEVKKAFDATTEAALVKSRFLANMSHEIRTPMNGVIGTAELLQRTELNKEQKNYVQIIEESGNSLLAIIDEILDFSKIEAGKMQLEQVKYSLTRLIESKIDLLSARACAKELKLHCFISPKIDRLLIGDPNRIGQILLNFLSNAIKFTSSGDISVKAFLVENSSSNRIRFEIKDSGIGLTEEQIKNLFQPFMQADMSTSRRFGGTGLGLSICQMLVKIMQGKIGVESKLGKGTTFWFEINQPFSDEYVKTVKFSDSHIIVLAFCNDDNDKMTIYEYYNSWGAQIYFCEPNSSAVQETMLRINSGPKVKKILLIDTISEEGMRFAQKFSADNKAEFKTIFLKYGNIESKNKQSEIYLKKPIHQSQLYDATYELLGIATKENEKEIPSMKNTRALNILVAEDNVTNQTLICKNLELLGHKATVVGNGLEVLKAVEKSKFDLILMDCQMPEMDGFTATLELRKREEKIGGHLLVIALTANALESDRQACLAAGMDDYLAKPIKQKKLIDTFEKWLKTELHKI